MSLKSTILVLVSFVIGGTATGIVANKLACDKNQKHASLISELGQKHQNEIKELKKEIKKAEANNASCNLELEDTKSEFKDFKDWRPEPNRPTLDEIKYIQLALRRKDTKSVVYLPKLVGQDLAWLRFGIDTCVPGSTGPYCVIKFIKRYRPQKDGG